MTMGRTALKRMIPSSLSMLTKKAVSPTRAAALTYGLGSSKAKLKAA